MREEGLQARKRRRFQVTTDSQHSEPIAPNVLERRFAAREIGQAYRIWAADITYIPTREGWLYLAVVLDLATRRLVAWAMKSTLDRSLAIDALQMALLRRDPARGVLHHSGRGVQSTRVATTATSWFGTALSPA
jgi:transposase InsO family protein